MRESVPPCEPGKPAGLELPEFDRHSFKLLGQFLDSRSLKSLGHGVGLQAPKGRLDFLMVAFEIRLGHSALASD